MFKHGMWTELAQFLVVGGMGTIVNLACLTALLAAGLDARLAVAGAIFAAMLFNFVLNRRFSFAVVAHAPWWAQFVGFVGASSVGATVNYALTLWLLARWAAVPPQAAALAGIAAGTLFNFVTSRYLVFRTAHIRSRSTR
jgi:dolichol-phosphate mannosyltransferase